MAIDGLSYRCISVRMSGSRSANGNRSGMTSRPRRTRLAEACVAGFAQGSDAAQADAKAAPHFLGAVVVELDPGLVGEVDVRLVVDGQRAPTTIQLLLRGVLDAFSEVGADKALGRSGRPLRTTRRWYRPPKC